MNKHKFTSENNLLIKKDKYTKVEAFLQAFQYKNTNVQCIALFAARLSISPDILSLLIFISANGGAFSYHGN
ncbi:MAG TPA: hypothetical protein VNG53_06235 [Bacteroidia bacterium]|nr:hypothetical protein [Bacteroidia bacterium]